MTVRRGLTLLTGLLLVFLAYWAASHTRWVDVNVPMPPKGEAAVNPFYAAQRFSEALGARTSRDFVFTTPSPDAVIVLSSWHWTLSTERHEAFERWVESGGRLVVDALMAGGHDDFEEWSGIVREYESDDEPDDDLPQSLAAAIRHADCRALVEARAGEAAPDPQRFSLCGVNHESWLASDEPPEWELSDASGTQVIRARVGQGTVTVINASPFRDRRLFDADHGRLFVAATGLRSGDEVHFLSEDNHPSLLTLLWRHGGPAVTLGLALVLSVLWRGAVRFGPLGPPQTATRRSLADQIRGTGQLALRHGDGPALVDASVRALHEAAMRRVKHYRQLRTREQAIALSRLTGFDQKALAAAIRHSPSDGAPELRRTIALLEAARRQTVTERTGRSHATT